MDGWMDGWMDVCMYVCMYARGVLGKFLPHLTLVFVVCQSLVFPAAAKRFSSLLNLLRGLQFRGCPLQLLKSSCLRVVCRFW